MLTQTNFRSSVASDQHLLPRARPFVWGLTRPRASSGLRKGSGSQTQRRTPRANLSVTGHWGGAPPR